MTRILWTCGPKGISNKMKLSLKGMVAKGGINYSDLYFASIYANANEKLLGTKNRHPIIEPTKFKVIKDKFDDLVNRIKPGLIVVNDVASLLHVTGQHSLNLCRGSVYFYNEIPCVIVDELKMIYASKQGFWIFINDIQKIGRWLRNEQRTQPKFTYSVCSTPEEIQECIKLLDSTIALSVDIETKMGRIITCIGYSLLLDDGTIRTFLIPFFDPTKLDGCYWASPELEENIWKLTKLILNHPVPKILQNGTYDCAFFILYHLGIKNYFIDTMHLMHSIWPESIKKLNFISSIFLDYCRFWKDENKDERKEERVTAAGIQRYWRYCCLDSYNTLLDARMLLLLYKKFGWIRFNYNVEFSTQVGPNMAMSMRGYPVNTKIKFELGAKLLNKHEEAKKKLQLMTNDPEFNANSPTQVASLLYDVLGAQPIKMQSKKKDTSRSTDEKILKRVAEQHPIFDIYIQAIWDVKKPLNNISKYIDLHLWRGRFMYALNCGATETWRCNSKKHQFMTGTNAQNIPEPMRHMYHADEGYFLVNADYSASDAVFMAYESEDARYIETVNSDKDTHCIHAEHFFRRPYADILKGYLTDDPVYAHPTKGIRPITKRITHGSNFMMQAFALYMLLGRAVVISAAQMLGEEKAYEWRQNQCVDFCHKLLQSYYIMYPRLKPYYKELHAKLIKDKSITNSFGMRRTFFGDLSSEHILREAVAFIGQSGTSSNINKALRRIWYESDLESQGMILTLQVHDNIISQIPLHRPYLVDKLLTIMDDPVIIHGRECRVKVDAKVGLHWQKKMIPWKTGMTGEEIHERTRII